jgi:hypothetical protein
MHKITPQNCQNTSAGCWTPNPQYLAYLLKKFLFFCIHTNRRKEYELSAEPKNAEEQNWVSSAFVLLHFCLLLLFQNHTPKSLPIKPNRHPSEKITPKSLPWFYGGEREREGKGKKRKNGWRSRRANHIADWRS